MSGLVVIGGSYAGVQAAISAREAGYAEDIVMVSDEDSLPYQRPPLSKAYLLDGVSEAGLVIRGEKFFAEQRIELILGKRAVRLDRTGAGVVLDDGRTLRCERIVIATGSRARSLAAAQGVAGVHSLRSLADARSLKQAIEKCSELVVIGGGFIGLEVAASAKKRGKNVVVVESAERLISRALSPTLSNFLYDAHRRRGVDVRLGLSVDKIVKTDSPLRGSLRRRRTVCLRHRSRRHWRRCQHGDCRRGRNRLRQRDCRRRIRQDERAGGALRRRLRRLLQ